MNVTFDKQVDAAYLRFSDAKVVDSDEISDGIIFDYDEQNKVVGIEVLNLRYRTAEEFQAIQIPLEAEEKEQLKSFVNLFTLI